MGGLKLFSWFCFQSRGNTSSSANSHDMQSIRNMEGNEVCVDCGAASKLGVLLLFFVPVMHGIVRISLYRGTPP